MDRPHEPEPERPQGVRLDRRLFFKILELDGQRAQYLREKNQADIHQAVLESRRQHLERETAIVQRQLEADGIGRGMLAVLTNQNFMGPPGGARFNANDPRGFWSPGHPGYQYQPQQPQGPAPWPGPMGHMGYHQHHHHHHHPMGPAMGPPPQNNVRMAAPSMVSVEVAPGLGSCRGCFRRPAVFVCTHHGFSYCSAECQAAACFLFERQTAPPDRLEGAVAAAAQIPPHGGPGGMMEAQGQHAPGMPNGLMGENDDLPDDIGLDDEDEDED